MLTSLNGDVDPQNEEKDFCRAIGELNTGDHIRERVVKVNADKGDRRKASQGDGRALTSQRVMSMYDACFVEGLSGKKESREFRQLNVWKTRDARF